MKSVLFRLGAVVMISILVLTCNLNAAEGDIIWARYFGGSLFEQGSDVIQCSDGGYAIAGSYNYTSLDPDFLLIRTDAQGNQVWTRTMGTSYRETASALVQTVDHGFGLVGTCDVDAFESNIEVWRTDSLGYWIWGNAYGGAAPDQGSGLIYTAGDNFIVVGSSMSFVPDTWEKYLLKLDGAGTQLWQNNSTYNSNNWAYAGKQLLNGNFVLAGAWSDGSGFVGMSDSTFTTNQYWTSAASTDGFHSVEPTSDGHYLAAGTTHSVYQADQMYLARLSSDFVNVTTASFGGAYPETGTDAVESPNGGYLIVGSTMSYGPATYSAWMVKTDANLDSLWSQYFAGGGNAWATSVIVNRDGNYIITGGVWNNTNNSYDAMLLCVEGHPLAVEPEPTLQPEQFSFNPPHPNPFNPSTTLTFTLPHPAKVSLEVFDINGRCVGAHGMRPAFYPAGTHTIPFDGSGLPSGIYFARLTAGELSQTQKLVLLK